MNNLVMHDPDLLRVLIDTFFAMRKEEKEPPTVPGLALGIGFTRTHDITLALKAWEMGESRYPEQSIHLLMQSITKIEDHCLISGMQDRMPAAIAKFALGAYHQVKEPSSNSEQASTAIQIIFEAPEHKQVSSHNLRARVEHHSAINNPTVLIGEP